jgi:quercetin dioxygenase-like cupin family protein
MARRYFINAGEVETYSPANHTGTVNRRLIGPDTVGSEHLELLEGTIEPGEGALLHTHPDLDQAVYVLVGTARAEIDGQVRDMGPGDVAFFPKGMPHIFTVTGDRPAKVLVIYTPPYLENPTQAVRLG